MAATLSLRRQRMFLTAAHGFTLSFAAPPADLLPCTGQVDVYPGELHVSCGLHRLPAVFQPLIYRF